MKKLLLLLVGVLTALCANANEIYLWGNNVSQGWTSNPTHYDNWKGANDPTVVSDTSNDGVFKFTAKGDFYLSKVRANNNDAGGWSYNKNYGLIVNNSSDNSCCWAKEGNLYKATMISRSNENWTDNSQAPSAWSGNVVYYKITKTGDTYKIEAATNTSDFNGGSTNSAPLNLIGDSYSPDDWNGTMKANYSAPDADVLTLKDFDGTGYYIFAAQGKFALSNQTVKGWGDGDNEWKKKSLKTGSWSENNGVYSATLSSTTSETALYAADAIKNSKVYFRVNAGQNKIECTTDVTKFGGVEIPETPEGTVFYVMGSFTAVPDTPIRLVPSGGRYTTKITCNNEDGWGSMVIYSVTPGEDGAEPTIRYYSSNGTKLQVGGSFYYGFPEVNSAENRIDLSNLNPDKSYTLLFVPEDSSYPDGWVRVSEYSDNHSAFYLSGDINVWSDVSSRNTASTASNKNHGYFSGEKVNNTDYYYLQDDPDNPWVRFKSIDEMESKWRFDYIGTGPNGETGKWYRLNLSEKGAADLNDNVGRLGGQFKIIGTDLEQTGDCYGVDRDNNENYWQKLVKIGERFTHGHKNGGQNYMLSNTVVENAVIWFDSDNGDVIIYGEPHDIYVYYANDAHPDYAPAVYIDNSTQANNYPHIDPYVNGSVVENVYDFSWHKIDKAMYYPYGKSGPAVEMENVWAHKIPSSIIHRTPMPYLTSVKPYDARNTSGDNSEWFPRVRIDCEDIWFIESTKNVNVFFRFADDAIQNAPATEVYFNAWIDQYDAGGSLMKEPKYLNKSMETGKMTYISKDSTDPAAQALWDKVAPLYRTSNGKDVSWFAYPGVLPTSVANAGYAMFATSYGGEYPSGFNGASVGDRDAVALNGHDLYFVVGGSSSRVGILYSHLKGTFVKGESDEIQINAEFFAKNHNVYKDGDLNTTIGSEVDYNFSILGPDGQETLGAVAERWFDEPYYTWNVSKCEPGMYTVKVKVRKLVGGKYEIYTSTDIYPIFATRD